MRRFLTFFVLGLVASAFAAGAPQVPTLTDAERAWLAAFIDGWLKREPRLALAEAAE